jgi:hypothetical protein
MTPEELEYYESLDRFKKSAFTKKKKYGENIMAEWGRKGGQAKVPKGFAMHRERISQIQKERHRLNRLRKQGLL